MKTFIEKRENTKETWYLVNAQGKTLGRLATKLATMLMGKNQATYTPHVPSNIHIVVTNAAGVYLSGKKPQQKVYDYYTGYTGGRREKSFKDMLKNKPEEIIRQAVKGMLPNNHLRAVRLKALRIFAGEAHTHAAQQPVELTV